jgi:hypothetical protein
MDDKHARPGLAAPEVVPSSPGLLSPRRGANPRFSRAREKQLFPGLAGEVSRAEALGPGNAPPTALFPAPAGPALANEAGPKRGKNLSGAKATHYTPPWPREAGGPPLGFA